MAITLPDATAKLYTQDGAKDPIVYALLYHPRTDWLWFVTEREDDLLFTLCQGFETEWGYSGLSELEANGVCQVNPWTPIALSKAKELAASLVNDAYTSAEAA
jgi:hypothetical protein